MKEIWKGAIYAGVDYSEWLEVSNLGRVRNPKTGTIRKQNLLKSGYYFVSFSMGSRDKKKTIRVHKAVAEAFIPNPENKPQVNHIDGDKLNIRVDNLEWSTVQENVQHSYDMGLNVVRKGNDNKNSKLTIEQVMYVKENHVPRNKEFGFRALGRKFNVSRETIRRAYHSEDWKE